MYIDGFRIGAFGKNHQDVEELVASARRNLDRWMTDNPGWRNLDDTQPGPSPARLPALARRSEALHPRHKPRRGARTQTAARSEALR